jgi:hypothetical protein
MSGKVSGFSNKTSRPVLSDGLAKCSELETNIVAQDELFSRLVLQLDAKGSKCPYLKRKCLGRDKGNP